MMRERGNVGLGLFINRDVNTERFMWKEKSLLGKRALGK